MVSIKKWKIIAHHRFSSASSVYHAKVDIQKSFCLMKEAFQDARFQLHQQMNVDYEQCPMHGKVDQKIRQIKEPVQKKKIMKERLSILQWETLAAEISNSIDNLPLAIGNITGDLENLDLITPNRLRLGRNND